MDKRYVWLVTLAILLALVISIMVFAEAVRILNKRAIDYLQKRIEGIENVSEDYKSGWRDCIKEFQEWMRGKS